VIVTLLNWILGLTAAVLVIPCAVLLTQCLAALLPPRRRSSPGTDDANVVAVLIPAHNEQYVIAPTIAAVKRQMHGRDRIIVVADNCTDDTARIACDAGAEVIVRHDPQLRGKGYALAFGVDYLEPSPPDVVVVLDADTHVHDGSIDALRSAAIKMQRPIQAVYLLDPPREQGMRDPISSLAFTFKNMVRPLGLSRLGLPCPLMGSGMAMPWRLIEQVDLATDNIVEDLQLGLDLAIAGYPTAFCADAMVTGHLPQQPDAARSQRRRWEHGHLYTMFTQVPRLLAHGLIRRKLSLLTMALDLAIPPLSFLMLGLIAILGASGALQLAGGSPWPAGVTLAAMMMMGTAVFAGWARFARHAVPLSAMLAAPLYILWKLPIYVGFVVRRETRWVRTERDLQKSGQHHP
jgi:cellulose synthase/poly-beta-1,6-N-acetylglucosamine synthase-like glycosyltransferase